MNKHDFYKELMSQYTFDESKIRRNAKRASSASFFTRNSKWLPLATAAAVFTIVFVGNIFMNGNRADITDNSLGDIERRPLHSEGLIPTIPSLDENITPFAPDDDDTNPAVRINPAIEDDDDDINVTIDPVDTPVVPGDDNTDEPSDDTNDTDDRNPVIHINPDDTDDLPAGLDEDPDDTDAQTILEIDTDNVQTAGFITENRLVMLTRNQVQLYDITEKDGLITYELAQSFDTHNPRINFTDRDSGTQLIIGSDAFGRQTDLFIADGTNGSLRRLDTSNVTQGMTDISYAVYNNGSIILKAQSASTHSIYAANRGSTGWSFELLVECTNRISILSRAANGFFYAIFEDDIKVYRYSMSSSEVSEVNTGTFLSSTIRFERSHDAGSFAAVSADGQRNWYRVQDMQLTEIAESDANQVGNRPVYSERYSVLDITPAQVRIEIN